MIINLILLWCIFFLLFIWSKSDTWIFFSYPNEALEFAWTEIPDIRQNYLIKEKFDKEFLNISYNLYQFFLYAKRMPLYMPFIEEQLHESRLPDDLKYLPIAESALRNDVVSSAWAAGIWQFMPETAKEYWLIVNEFIDERYHFEKSTLAAIKYLQDLHDKFKNWPLALAWYNRGQNAIAKALNDQNVTSYFDLQLNDETSRYLYRILAIKYVIQDYEKKKSSLDTLIWGVYEKPETKKIPVNQIDNIEIWAQENGYSGSEIKLLNPWILQNSLPEGDWELEVMKK